MTKKDILQKAGSRIADADTQTADIKIAPAGTTPPPAADAPKKDGPKKHRTSFCKRCISGTRCGVRYVFVKLPSGFWNWIRSVNIIGLANSALLLAIIIMFSLLISRVLDAGCDTGGNNDTTPQTHVVTQPIPRAPAPTVAQRTPISVSVPARVTVDATNDRLVVAMPLQRVVRPATAKAVPQPTARPVRPARVTPTDKPAKPRPKHLTPRAHGVAPEPLVAQTWSHGDTIVDGEYPGTVTLAPGAGIRGNLILQNHRRYTLPCGIHVKGNLLLRNVGQLRFCDDFTITGNIYVSRDSSFGPIPRSARLGGNVIF
ncbi:MAG: hypothetical protein FWE64_04285 [Alphaproteobacteria bacterium]|nr:hypothetical protein [Alphaproteobacteria bacterium]